MVCTGLSAFSAASTRVYTPIARTHHGVPSLDTHRRASACVGADAHIVRAHSFDATFVARFVFRSPKGNIDQRDTSIPPVPIESGEERASSEPRLHYQTVNA